MQAERNNDEDKKVNAMSKPPRETNFIIRALEGIYEYDGEFFDLIKSCWRYIGQKCLQLH